MEREEHGCALILGITGQDGSYLAEYLLTQGVEVHGMIRRASTFNTGRIDHILDRIHLHYGDVLDNSSIRHILTRALPTEVYNLAAQSHVKVSFDQPVYSTDTVSIGAANVLDAVRDYRDMVPWTVRVYQAGSSEMFGSSSPPQNEDTAFKPLSPYACAKVHAFHLARVYREAYGMHIVNGILFNHESPRRGETFVTRKITRAVGRMVAGLQDQIRLGNMWSIRDWGWAPDFVQAMVAMMHMPTADDYVIGTGVTATVDSFCRACLEQAGLYYDERVIIDDRYMRPLDVPCLEADATKAVQALGWRPSKTVDEILRLMLRHDVELAKAEARSSGVNWRELECSLS